MPEFTMLPDGSRERRLVKPLLLGDRSIDVLRLRPPRYKEIMQLGDPSSLIVLSSAVLPSHDMSVVSSYIDALVVDEQGIAVSPSILEHADYRDALALKDAVLDFFRKASASTLTGTPTP